MQKLQNYQASRSNSCHLQRPSSQAKARVMTLTVIDLHSKIARFFNFRILGGNTHLNFLFIGI